MSTLREQVEALRDRYDDHALASHGEQEHRYEIRTAALDAVLALIPEGAVLVTERDGMVLISAEGLSSGLRQHQEKDGRFTPPLIEDDAGHYRYANPQEFAAAILTSLRGGLPGGSPTDG